MAGVHRYVSPDEDSGRWVGFEFRDGDIIVSTRSKTGTTWLQMICALLVFGTPDLPAPLDELSPWLDHLVEPIDDVLARLAAQEHRRVVKTHTPLDGIPLDPRATYLVAGRHPLDSAVSLYHQGDNIDRARLAELTGSPAPGRTSPRPDLHTWLVEWITSTADPREAMDSLPGVLWHLSDSWSRRREPNVLLVHYADLSADLDAQMRRIADVLAVPPPAPDGWPALVDAATFASMRARSTEVIPGGGGILKDPAAFFRRGRSGAGAEVLSAGEFARYERRAAELAPADLLAWLHR